MEQMIEQILKDATSELGVMLTDRMVGQFVEYYRLLIEWNQKMNLTAITEPEEVVMKHFTDSLTLVHVMEGMERHSLNMIDIGTGAGFPGIPLKIVFPNLSITLLDSLNKRVRFLDEVCGRLGLDDVKTCHGRAEEYGRNLEYRERYDICVSRAVSNLATLSEYCLPFVRTGGYFISYKSEKAIEELKGAERAIRILGGEIGMVHEFVLNGTDAKRVLIKINKVKQTGARYPRKAGIPGKEPIG